MTKCTNSFILWCIMPTEQLDFLTSGGVGYCPRVHNKSFVNFFTSLTHLYSRPQGGSIDGNLTSFISMTTLRFTSSVLTFLNRDRSARRLIFCLQVIRKPIPHAARARGATLLSLACIRHMSFLTGLSCTSACSYRYHHRVETISPP